MASLPHTAGEPGHGIVNVAAATVFCSCVSAAMAALAPACRHWLLVPVTLCGILCGIPVSKWLAGRLDLFDPAVLVGMLGLHFYYLAPLLNTAFDLWMTGVAAPPDWREWIARMAVMNALGLLLYARVRDAVHRGLARARPVGRWRLRRAPFFLALGGAAVVSVGLQAWVYWRFGGLSGYVESYLVQDSSWRGMGVVFAVSESLPILLAISWAVSRWGKPRVGVAVISGVVAAVFLAQVLFGGLRGSRGNVMWVMFWTVSIVHYSIRRLPRTFICTSIICFLAFMYLYGLYKGAGKDLRSVLEQPEYFGYLEQRSGRTLGALLVRDLGRADVQAYILYRLTDCPEGYELAWGRTYAAAAALVIPSVLWPERPATKVKEGTEIQYGAGAWAPSGWYSSRVYGLAGEAMLNFGPAGGLLSFGVLGLVAGGLRWMRTRLAPFDMRWLLLPLGLSFMLRLLVMDSDNLVFYTIKSGLVPALVVWIGSVRVRHYDAVPWRAVPHPLRPVGVRAQ